MTVITRCASTAGHAVPIDLITTDLRTPPPPPEQSGTRGSWAFKTDLHSAFALNENTTNHSGSAISSLRGIGLGSQASGGPQPNNNTPGRRGGQRRREVSLGREAENRAGIVRGRVKRERVRSGPAVGVSSRNARWTLGSAV
ncbi:hypothetical protein AAFF_G00226800 [Aldrovandia affinis]|uniref:Uncharacterized protein n=1 Tax=Aldrovandia affinis TaxID=143900 RepID=A0AAD7X2A2_9TELE|nr:hypothetical protein AAFF_G00226800 [Aldrovandia affinis]